MTTEIDNKITSKDISDTLSVVGIVVIENGENKVIGTNHWVGQGLETIGSYLVGGAGNGAASKIYIGSDTLIPTTVSMTGLISPIGSAPGTAPNTFNVSYSINLSSTIPATIVYNAIWNAGTVSGTLGEVGLYLQGYGGLSGSTYATNPGLGARMAAADGVFTPFIINTSVALNVSWFIRFIYSSGTSVTQYITSPSLPSDPSQQPIVSITNSQSTPAPAGLQVMWQAPISSLQAYFNQYGINLNSNLSNMRILYNGQYVPAWIESINNDTAIIWMKTPVSIPANSSISLSLNAGPSFNFDGVYWGEAPQLSPTYGQYDNGASVFNYYTNFAGTSLPAGWTSKVGSSGGTVIVNNGVKLNTVGGNSANYNASISYDYTNILPSSKQIIVDTLEYVSATGRERINCVSLNFDSGIFGQSEITSGNLQYFWNGTYYSPNNPAFAINVNHIVQLILANTVYYWNILSSSEVPIASQSTSNFSLVPTFSIGDAGDSGVTQTTVYWVRFYTYPPNGVMPKVSLL
jgi:hypothetical protein